ncbi:MAG: M14 family metallocarboxypeptidase [Xanthomonadales bacterium]|nr:M14 family metallocarboxypeptidase [Xanthomonadales bacterium]
MLNRLFLVMLVSLVSSQALATDWQTPLEKSGWTMLTTHKQLMDYLKPLVDSSPMVEMKTIGTSVSGNPIPALYFSKDDTFASQRDKKPVVMIIAQQHGDEPSSKEAAMIVARRLLNDDSSLLNKLDLILVPQVNPDGSDKGSRRNAIDMDLNRNHVILSEPESYAIHQLFLDWMPEVTLDVHEYNAVLDRWIEAGYIKDADEMLGGVTNVNIDPEIIHFTRNIFIPETGRGVEEDGFRFHRYIVGEPFENGVVRFSTTAINDSRQSMGIYNTLSFIIEGKRYGNLTNEIEKRTKGQVSAMINFLKTTDRHAENILSIVVQARMGIAQDSQSLVQMDYFPDPEKPTLNFPVFDLKSWTHTNRDLDSFRPSVRIKKSVRKPDAYYFDAKETRLIALLKRHRIGMLKLKRDKEITTETYHIKHITDAVDEGKHAFVVDLKKTIQTETLQAGAIIVPVEGAASNLIPLLLEPESNYGIVSTRGGGKHRFESYLVEGKPYPVKRLSSIEHLDFEEPE